MYGQRYYWTLIVRNGKLDIPGKQTSTFIGVYIMHGIKPGVFNQCSLCQNSAKA